jgi:hypothetical protein
MIELPKGVWNWLSDNARDLSRIAAALEGIARETAEIRKTMQEDGEKEASR